MRKPTRSAALLVPAVAALAIGISACSSPDDTASNAGLSPDALAGKKLAATRCLGCHSLDGKNRSGPTLKGLAGSDVALEDGRTVKADSDYLVRSIRDAGAEVVKGYPNIMGSAVPKDSISEEQARQIVAYIETIK